MKNSRPLVWLPQFNIKNGLRTLRWWPMALMLWGGAIFRLWLLCNSHDEQCCFRLSRDSRTKNERDGSNGESRRMWRTPRQPQAGTWSPTASKIPCHHTAHTTHNPMLLNHISGPTHLSLESSHKIEWFFRSQPRAVIADHTQCNGDTTGLIWPCRLDQNHFSHDRNFVHQPMF